MNIPNLDCMDADELRAVARHATRLASYAARLAIARSFRARGLVTAALMQEQRCDAIYSQLPPEWRW